MKRAFTLLEAIVAGAMLLLLLALTTRALISALSTARRGEQSASLQNQAAVSLNWLTADLRQTKLPQVTLYSSSDRAALGLVRFSDRATSTGMLVWEQNLVAYSWHRPTGRLTRRLWPPQPPALSLTLSPGYPAQVTSDQLRQIAETEVTGQRLLATRLKLFEVVLQADLMNLRLLLEDGAVKFQMERSLCLKSS